jgi:hypothetical protein
MQLYIDKENLESFISKAKDPMYSDCTKAMQRQLDITFNFSKDELKSDDILLKWFSMFSEGAAETKKEFNEVKFPDRPLKSNSYNSFDINQLSAIYLINDEKLSVLKEKGAVLIGEIGEEIQILKQLFFFHDDYKFEKKLIIGSSEFSEWQHLEKYSSVTSDILIFDPYILSDSSLIDSNFLKLLRVLCTKSRCKLSIVLYTDIDQIQIDYTTISAKVRQEIQTVTGISPNFTIVKYRKQKNYVSFAEHDRTIFTNYFRVYSGDSFNYFKSDGTKITTGREIHLIGFADKENHNLALELIKDIQNNIIKLPSEAIEGDKKSNFLNFK